MSLRIEWTRFLIITVVLSIVIFVLDIAFHTMLAPRIIGGVEAPAAVGGTGVPSLAASRMLDRVSVETAGPDLVVTGYCVR